MAVRPIQPGELVELSSRLSRGTGSGRGRPRTIDLRRAVSTAYYAVFPNLGQHAAMRLIGDGWSQQHSSVARWITHTELAQLANAANGIGNQALRSALNPVDPRLADLAQIFLDLQVARHDADYNDLFDVNREQAVLAADSAKKAVDLANVLFKEQDASYQRFLGPAFGGVKVAKTR